MQWINSIVCAVAILCSPHKTGDVLKDQPVFIVFTYMDTARNYAKDAGLDPSIYDEHSLIFISDVKIPETGENLVIYYTSNDVSSYDSLAGKKLIISGQIVDILKDNRSYVTRLKNYVLKLENYVHDVVAHPLTFNNYLTHEKYMEKFLMVPTSVKAIK